MSDLQSAVSFFIANAGYTSRDMACRMTALRSQNANLRGEYSQFEVRAIGDRGFVGGPCDELAKRFPTKPVVKQYSAGYAIGRKPWSNAE